MLRMLGSPKTRLEAIGFNCGLAVLVLALLLGVVSPGAQNIQPSSSLNSVSSAAAPQWVGVTGPSRPISEAPAGPRTPRATIDRAGWPSFLPRAFPGPSAVAPVPAPGGLPALLASMLKPWPVMPGTAPLMALVAYSPHAPPSAQ